MVKYGAYIQRAALLICITILVLLRVHLEHHIYMEYNVLCNVQLMQNLRF